MKLSSIKLKQSESRAWNSPLIEVPHEKRIRSAIRAGVFALVIYAALYFLKVIDFVQMTQVWQWLLLFGFVIVFAFGGYLTGFPHADWRYD